MLKINEEKLNKALHDLVNLQNEVDILWKKLKIKVEEIRQEIITAIENNNNLTRR